MLSDAASFSFGAAICTPSGYRKFLATCNYEYMTMRSCKYITPCNCKYFLRRTTICRLPRHIRLHKEDRENSAAYRLQIRRCQPSQEGALGGMCLAKLLHRQLEPSFIPLANGEIMQVH